MLTLDETIIFMEELLNDDDHWSCENAKTEYRQVQEWLKELKEFREMPKSDLISREALKKAFEEVYPLATNEIGGVANKRIYELIDNAPTVAEDYDTGYQDGLEDGLNDIRPTGEWIIDQEGDKNTVTLVTCPFCKERHCCKMNFCGNCGADMRGGAE